MTELPEDDRTPPDLELPLLTGEAADAHPPSLPGPEVDRFLPLRAGILNLWQFENQELWFHQGRLILRGENGTGKSKALELLLPFLLDADLSPQRLDPFASTARSMAWNLLEDRLESRLGYVWLELGRRIPTREGTSEEYLTLGCGLRASRRAQRVDSWYFLTPRRVRDGLELLSGRQPLTKEQLRNALGDGGEIFDSGRDYREQLDARVFALGEDRFAALRHLLLQLRRPHLSEKLDPESLSDLLTESLPPLDADLVGEVSESFERLEQDQSELARIAASVESVAGFLEIYREYARGVTRDRAADVRRADSRYHDTAGDVRRTEAEQQTVRGQLAQLEAGERADEEEITASRAAVRALEQSDAMRQAAALSAKRSHAADLEKAAERDRSDLRREAAGEDTRRRDQEAAQQAARVAEDRALAEAETAAGIAEEVGLAAVHGAAQEVLPQQPDRARATVQAALRERREGVTELLALRTERERTRQRHAIAEERRRETQAQAESAGERRRGAEIETERQREELLTALDAWRGELSELSLSETEWQELLDLVIDRETGESPGDLAGAVRALAAAPRDRLVARRTANEQEVERLENERAEIESEHAEVAAAREVPPPAPRTRSADRTARPGAPLYLLCEFAPELSAVDRAGLEAALEAAGLLDAWVSPRGHVLDPETLDTRWVPTPREGAGTLAELLVPAPGHGVEREEIAALLASVDLDAEPGGNRRQRVSTDGRFELGPLAGAWTKPAAEHVGASAREAARLRRLEELETQLAQLDRDLTSLAERRDELARRLESLEQEVAAAPSVTELTAALARARAAREEETRRLTELAEAERLAAEARRAREAAEEHLAKRARELDLAPFADDLEGYRDALRGYEASVGSWLRGVAEARRTLELETQARARWAEAKERRAEAERRAAAAGDQARAAWSEYQTLEAAVGAEAREILDRHQQETERLARLEASLKRLRQATKEAGETLAGLAERHRLKSAERDEHDTRRGKAVFRLQRLGQAGLLSLLSTPLPEEPPAQWSLTRSLELARALEQELSHVDLAETAAQRRANRLHAQFQTLIADLGAEFHPSLGQEDEGLMIVRVAHNQAQLDPQALLEVLSTEEATRRDLLAREERELLLRFLLGEIGDHLRQRLRQARELVDEMNTELTDCATASGITLKLAWKALDDEESPARTIVPLLTQSAEMLADVQRRELQDFFHTRIVAARQQWQAVPWREHLLKALDYRRWHRFQLLRRDPVSSDWRELTKRSHAASSGGEKAVALHLPLFAAAAAHYRSADPKAPRLILLDEAFAGIDDGMRGRLMGLLVRFDLDFMMTSHDEWGCYRELPGVATYHLARDPMLRGVLATRFLWDGERLAEDAQAPR